MQLDRKATEVVLNKSQVEALPSRWKAKAQELRDLAQNAETVSLSYFLDETGLELTDVYDGQGTHGWSALCEQAGIDTLVAGTRKMVYDVPLAACSTLTIRRDCWATVSLFRQKSLRTSRV